MTSSCPSHGGVSLFILFLSFWRNTESSNRGKRTNFVIIVRLTCFDLLTFSRRRILLFVKEKALLKFILYPVFLGHNKWMFDRIVIFFSQISAILPRVVICEGLTNVYRIFSRVTQASFFELIILRIINNQMLHFIKWDQCPNCNVYYLLICWGSFVY